MKLRTRFAVILGGFALMLTGLAVAIMHAVLVRYAVVLDEGEARQEVERGLAVLSIEQDSLMRTVADWASWDDTYAYLVDGGEEYVESNLVEGTLRELRLSVIALYDNQGGRVMGKAFDLDADQSTALPTRLLEHVEGEGQLISQALRRGRQSGLIIVGEDIWFVAVAPVLHSDDQGPPAGSLLMARRLGASESKRLAVQIHETMELSPAVGGGAALGVSFWNLNGDIIVGQAFIEEVCGHGGVALRLQLPRTAYSQGMIGVFYLAGWILVCGAAITLCGFWILDRWVLQSLTNSAEALKDGIQLMADGRVSRPPLPSSSTDEMGELATAVDGMLDALGRSQQSLRDSETRYRGLVEAMPEAIVGLERDGRILFGNAAFLNLACVPAADHLQGRRLSDLLPGPGAQRIEERAMTCPEGQSIRIGPEWLESTGEAVAVEVVLVRMPPAGSNPPYVLASLSDVTARLRAEREAALRREEATQAQKLAALGTLVAGVAHEVNNPNGIINLNATVARRLLSRLFAELKDRGFTPTASTRVGTLTELERELDETQHETLNASARIAGFVSAMKRFAQPGSRDLGEVVDVNGVIRRACEWLDHEIAMRQIKLALELAADLPPVLGNAQQLQQVFVNLLQNACHATTTRGAGIIVRTSYAPAEGRIHASVHDEGSGIAPEDLERVMEPFFTTRRQAGGTGLGLSISVNIVEAHRGKIRIESEVNKGTCVTVTLPVGKEGRHGD